MILVLGGTAEARTLADALDDAGLDVLTSLAGRVSNPRLPRGRVRVGGFGGPEAFAAWLRTAGIAAVVDATHPFAARISSSAAQACPAAGVPLLRLERPGFSERPGDRWTRVADLAAAAAVVRSCGGRVLLTTGRQGLAAFAGVTECWFLIRCVEMPAVPLPSRHELLLDRGPYTLKGELELIDRHRIDRLVTKDSGGAMTECKLDAARERELAVIVVERPRRPDVRTVPSVREALSWAGAAAGTSP
ncbi:MAG TPA: cobalt-precorrin-6A reductase [Solirubrobacteraceae bacterium]|nr:cobalt-precorrin-6A reductase [Solirubrobacteraceae bacterium]